MQLAVIKTLHVLDPGWVSTIYLEREPIEEEEIRRKNQ